jgi:hypothetical protein
MSIASVSISGLLRRPTPVVVFLGQLNVDTSRLGGGCELHQALGRRKLAAPVTSAIGWVVGSRQHGGSSAAADQPAGPRPRAA